jgi:hypothetical protein
VGQQAGHALPRLHKVKTIGIPFAIGPMWVDSCGADGDNSMSFCQRVSDSRQHNLAPCWRHEVIESKSVIRFEADSQSGISIPYNRRSEG